ncbi:PIN domain-containing protein [Limnofasciculus baicalensis]|uniref:PIN domain-containing protein n=1 Tax=Limnofasciculus baicalensis BBK-W-15 TaxID=2699891 RepID=A0AAE3GTA9_9CYAN|nr:PIN domain-containing protein [Limnofasciculus baicalensis]MCP2728137.1 PIN domain-containing protein [Limnofasciculus baicalensis BBK-W-15]
MILYLETNFLISISTGRDPQANRLLESTPSSVQLVIPSVCYMESLSALEQQQKYSKRFGNELDLQISQVRRDVTSSQAKSLYALLRESKNQNEQLLKDIESRLFQALNQISSKAEMIELTVDMVQESLNRPFFRTDHTDNLILYSILHHARLHPNETKAFLSSNSREFGQAEVQEALTNAGVVNYFSSTQNFIVWRQSQSGEE